MKRTVTFGDRNNIEKIMKTIYVKDLILWLLPLFVTCQALSQTRENDMLDTSDRMTREFTLDKEDLNQDIKIRFQEELKKVTFDFSGEIKSGSLELTIQDPNGKYEGGFSLKRNKGTALKNKNATGNFQKSITNPLNGTWVIGIEASGVEGKFKIVMTEELNKGK